MMIEYVRGDATYPRQDEVGLIIHICNDRGGWGRGFVLALSKRWSAPETEYRRWHRTDLNSQGEPFELGNIQCVQVSPSLSVINMIAQTGYGKNNRALHKSSEPDATPPIRYDALEKCLEKVAIIARELGASVHMPRIGCGLAGASWDLIEPIVVRQLSDLTVIVYDYAP